MNRLWTRGINWLARVCAHLYIFGNTIDNSTFANFESVEMTCQQLFIVRPGVSFGEWDVHEGRPQWEAKCRQLRSGASHVHTGVTVFADALN
jgi:hypothetical protein